MKRNLATVILLAFTILNLVLNVIIVFTLVPESKKVNNLIAQIAGAIDLDLKDDVTGEINSASDYPIDQIEVYTLADDITVNLKPGEDGSSSHVAVLNVGIQMNIESEGYKKYGSTIADNETTIRATLISTVSSFSYEEIMADKQALKDACTKALDGVFDSSDFIVGVQFSSEIYQ